MPTAHFEYAVGSVVVYRNVCLCLSESICLIWCCIWSGSICMDVSESSNSCLRVRFE